MRPLFCITLALIFVSCKSVQPPTTTESVTEVSQPLAATDRNRATCNAIGTPSQGWYINGRLLLHSRTCNTEVLACNSDQSKEGWFVQKKTNRVRIATERCAWRREKPVCKTSGDGSSAWYLGERLVARDDECHQKQIECVPSPKSEGWFTFKRSDPRLLVASGCGGLQSGQSIK